VVQAEFFEIVDEGHIKREREKARKLRKTRWWKTKQAAGRCHYCGRVVGSNELTMDHIVPVARGGRSSRGNVVPCCMDCNRQKQLLTPVEWQAYLDGSLAVDESERSSMDTDSVDLFAADDAEDV
jgi:CRISPR/Cas system Type II protein with McrA/HNH and RuvC-like nuclease domain